MATKTQPNSGHGYGMHDTEISVSSPRCLPVPLLPFSPIPPVSRWSFCLLLCAYCLVFSTSCRQDMQDQPRMKPLRSTSFFPDGMSSRAPVTNVPRGHLRADTEFFTGKRALLEHQHRQRRTAPPPGASTAQGLRPIPMTSKSFHYPLLSKWSNVVRSVTKSSARHVTV